MNDEIHEIPSTTPHLRTELARQLQELVPEAITDGKVDVTKLTELLADDVADSSERFGLFWPGKKRALRAAQEPTTATLRPMKDQSKDWDTTKNVFIEGDNLEVLKILQKHYHGKIKMIYIDPPYNTGKDFVYPDNYKEGLETYLEWTKQVNEEGKKVSTNNESEGRYHSNWLNMMYPRLKLARNLLTDDGVIFISIDDSEYDNLKKLLSEVFGESNVIATLIWKNKKGGGNDAKHVAVEHEYVLMVSRASSKLPKLFVAHSDEYLQRYKESDEFGRYFWDTFKRKSGKQYYPIEAPDGTVLEFDEHGNRLSWLRSQDRFKSDLESGDARFVQIGSRWSVQFKQREPEGKKPRSILVDEGTTSTGSAEVLDLFTKNVFDNPKPRTLICHLASIVTHGDDLILDFFAGSGTTAHAVMALNAQDGGRRRHIQVQLPEPTPVGSVARVAGFPTIASVARTRIDLAGDRIKDELKGDVNNQGETLDVGYRTFTLVDTNFSKWRATSEIDSTRLEQHLLELRESADGVATPDSLLYELLLKQGYSLTEESREVVIAGLTVHAVGGGLLLAYLDEHTKPSLDQLRAVVDEEPARLVILEDAFHGDDELKTNLAQLCKSKGVELWTA
ncbi:site-specific DNA-methyltransferase [Janibacter alkaliphilus]|uniref:Adenine-specific DNA-methyltransferase n=1 Tax=Janibacter alkaliphilus TaxID=1069963 RepID=A0A852X8Z9_9MICO|nr:site-specific DNA-methyltransferase [Janibacter alkaliphilus]NYG37970.1 adenine-specific DNA-methyltransferase [Janibacter alkaliphilus]